MSIADFPEDYIHLFQDKKFLQSTFESKSCIVVGSEQRLGVRYVFGYFCVEYYTGDKEPDLLPFIGFRIVVWSPISIKSKPRLWFRMPCNTNRSVYSFLDIRNKDSYVNSWSRTFKHYAGAWSRQEDYVIKEISYEEYITLCPLYLKPEKYLFDRIFWLERYYRYNKDALHFFVLESKDSGEIVSGVATADYLSVKQSYYITAFTRKDIAPPQAGLWLLKYWMDQSNSRGVLFANLGAMWTKGQPEGWKGFSNFKEKFNPRRVILQRELIRFTFSFFNKN